MERNMVIILLFFALLAFLSTGIWIVVEKKADRCSSAMQWVRTGIFFFHGFYFAASAVKYLIGNWEDTLLESFWDMGIHTFVHYGAPLAAAAVLFPVAVSLVFRGKCVQFITLLNQYVFFGVFLLLLSNGKINNKTFTWFYAAGIVLSVLFAVFYKKDTTFANGRECRKNVLGFLPVIGSWIVMNGIFLPNELYLTNMDEFKNAYAGFFGSLLLGAIVLGGIAVILAAAVLTVRSFHLFKLLLFGIVLMNYLQYILLNGKLDLLDGNEQKWSAASIAVNLGLWIAIIAAVIALGIKKGRIIRVYNGICLYIILIQLVTLGVMCLTTELDNASYRAGLTDEYSLELSGGNNILVFILDNFDNRWFQELKAEDPEFVAPLNDFCFYDNATSQFAHTSTAIPYLLTGVAWSEEMGELYGRTAYENSDFLHDLRECGFDVGIYTHGGYLTEKEYGDISNYSEEIKRTSNVFNTISTMWKCSMYKTLPFALKDSYMYYTDEINGMTQAQGQWDIDNDFPFYESLIGEGLSVNDAYENAFRFYHMRGAHAPYYMSADLKFDKSGREVSREEQERGCLRIVYEYLEQLKTLDLYDSATIIITADHGNGVSYTSGEQRPETVSMPVLLVKEAYQTSDEMQVLHAPVTQGEILPTIIRAAGGDSAAYGACLDEIPIDAKRERSYVSIYKNYIIQYTINGDANDINSWKTKKADFK